MAITTNTFNLVKPPVHGKDFAVSVYSGDASGAEDILAAEAGKTHYVNKLIISTQSVTDVTVDIGSGQGTGVTTIHLGPIPMPDGGGNITIDFGDKYMACTAGLALAVDTSAACPIWILAIGRTV
jgi:hypothetical protein